MSDAITALSDAGVSATTTPAALAPDQPTLASWGISAKTPADLTTLADELLFAANAFRLGVVSTFVIPALEDDPHTAFSDGTATTTSDALTGVLPALLFCARVDERAFVLAQRRSDLARVINVVLVVFGDTPHDPFDNVR